MTSNEKNLRRDIRKALKKFVSLKQEEYKTEISGILEEHKLRMNLYPP